MDYKWTPEEKKVIDGLQFELEYAKRNNLASARVPRGMLEKGLNMLESQQERIAIMTEGGWHDAKTDPPKQPGYYIIFDDGSEFSARYETDLAEALGIDSDEKAWFILSEDGIQWLYPSHWANLPEPPKEGEA